MTGAGPGALVAFLACTDLDRARAFYEGTLGLTFVEQTPFACVFDARGTMLRVTKVAEVTPAGYTVLGWDVADLASAMRDLHDRGVEFGRFGGVPQDDEGVWTAPGGDRVAWFHDPDGNTLSLAQFSRQA